MPRQIYLVLAIALVVLALSACGGSTSPNTQAPAAASPLPTLVPAVPTSAPVGEATTASEMPTEVPTEPAAVSSPSAPAAQPTTASSGAPSGSASDLILRAAQAALGRTARMTITIKDSNSTDVKTNVMEFQPPNRFHMGVGTAQEVIVIKNQGTWLKQGTQWVKSPVDLSDLIPAAFDPKEIEQLQKDMKTTAPQFVGPDVLNGKPMFVYGYTSTYTNPINNQETTTQNKMWIGATDGLPYQATNVGPSSEDPTVTTTTTITYDYDAKVDIQPPQ